VRRFVFKPRWILGHLFVLAAAYTCLRLGGWQLGKAHLTAAALNWGYAFQWPLFAVCFLIGWWRMLLLESRRLDDLEREGPPEEPAGEPPPAPAPPPKAVQPADEDDAEGRQLAAYNRMLAALAAKDSADDQARGRR
jgi:hypothetical protein